MLAVGKSRLLALGFGFALVAALAGCASRARPASSVAPAAFRVAGHTVAYQPPADWQPGHSPGAQRWLGRDGRLVVIGFGPDRSGAGRDPVARVKWLLEDRARRSASHERRQVRALTAVSLDGRPAARAVTRDRDGGVETGLYTVVGDELLGLTFYTDTPGAPEAAKRLDALAASVDLDGSLSADASPGGPGTVAGDGPRGRHHRRRPTMAEGVMGDLARIVIPTVIFLLFTALPAFMGAGAGWDMAHLLRQDPVRGASWGAYRATGIGIFAATLIVVVLIGWVFGQAPGGSGVMSGAMAGALLIAGVAFLAVFAGAIGGLAAALGAAIGGKKGRDAACWYAAGAAALGVLVTPWVLKFTFMAMDAGDDHHRHHRRGLGGGVAVARYGPAPVVPPGF